MNSYPNLDRLAQRDPGTLTAREVQVVLICRDANTPSVTKVDQAAQTVRLGRDVPALLAHIDELYGQIERLRDEASTTRAELASLAKEDRPGASTEDLLIAVGGDLKYHRAEVERLRIACSVMGPR